ncbi:hypothetical protein QUB52_18835 [Microcoleus sp. A6-C6]
MIAGGQIRILTFWGADEDAIVHLAVKTGDFAHTYHNICIMSINI